MKINFYGLDREYRYLGERFFIEIAKGVFSKGKHLQGRHVGLLESHMEATYGRKYAIAVGSCTDALYFALRGHGIGRGDTVLVPNLTFIATASAVVRTGAAVQPVDVHPSGLMNLDDAEKRITENTKAMIYVPLFGQIIAPFDSIEAFAREKKLTLIEDAAQSMGAFGLGAARFNLDYLSGTLGETSCFSFDPTKSITGCGSGGMVLTDNDSVVGMTEKLRYHGLGKGALGYNSQMSELSAAVIYQKLHYMGEFRQMRREVAKQYDVGLRDLKCLYPMEVEDHWSFHKYVVRCETRGLRDALKTRLKGEKIETRVHYPYTIHRAWDLAVNPLDAELDLPYPQSNLLSDCLLSLPIHPFLEREEVVRVIDAIRKVTKGWIS